MTRFFFGLIFALLVIYMFKISLIKPSVFRGNLFVPRGIQGINHLVQAEIKDTAKLSQNGKEVEKIQSLSTLSRLRIPQSIWIPLITDREVSSITDAADLIKQYQGWQEIPSLASFGSRVSISADSSLSSNKNKTALLEELKRILRDHQLDNSEFSLRISPDDKMSLSFNAIPPRVWLDSPLELTMAEKSIDWWSVKSGDVSRPSEPSESAIKLFRNEASLACLCSAFLRTSPLGSSLASKKEEEILLWDPFAGNGALFMQLLQTLTDQTISAPKTITIIGNVQSRGSMDACIRRFEKWYSSMNLVEVPDGVTESSGQRMSGRKSRREKLAEESEVEEEVSGLFTRRFEIPPNVRVNLHLTRAPFQETLPYISGAGILTHIPRTYSEMTGIDKHDLTEWAAFGSLLKQSSDQIKSAMFFTETNSFLKYSKLRTAKMVHLISPNGKSIGHFSKWIPF